MSGVREKAERRKERMNKKEILDILDNAKDERGAVPMRLVRKAFDKLPTAQPEERTDKHTESHACDLINRQVAINAVDTIGYIATMQDGDKCVRRSAVEYTLSMLPPAQPELIEKAAYIRGFEQGRTQGMIDSQGGKK